MTKALRVSLLVLLLTGTARAGWMPNGSPQPPQPPTQEEQQTTTDESTTEGDTPDEAEVSLTEITLSLLLGVLTLP